MGGRNTQSRRRRVVAALGALTLSLAGAVGAASSAAADSGDIVAGTEGSIVIHKHEHQTTTDIEGSPAEATSIPNPIENVTFTAYRITSINLLEAAGWAAVDAYALSPTACNSGAPAGTTLADSETTDSNGVAEISPLAIGAYIVCETAAPANVVDRALPFLVTVPHPYHGTVGTSTQSWLYDVHVYPKNGLATVSKSVDSQSELGRGAIASFPVTTDVNKIADDAYFRHYWVQDPMDSRLGGVAVSGIEIVSGGAGAVDPDLYDVDTEDNLVTVAFNEDGLLWLKNNAPMQLRTTFTGTVGMNGTTPIALGDGEINNRAYFSAATIPGDEQPEPDEPPATPTGIISNQVTQNWGSVSVTKVDAGDDDFGLAGAKFEVYEAAAPYGDSCTTAIAGGDTATPIQFAGVPDARFTSNGDGLVTIPGLFISDSVNDPGRGADSRCYVLKEVVAPVGFILPEAPDANPFTAIRVELGTATTSLLDIPNTRVEGVTLPMTGSNGIVALSVAGTALIAAGLVLGFMARRRRQTA